MFSQDRHCGRALTAEVRQQMSHKRRRLILSCNSCRQRKVKCDHGDPCLQCQKSGHAEECTYYASNERYPSLEAPEKGSLETHNGREPNSGQIRLASPHCNTGEQPRKAVEGKGVEIESYAESAGARPFSSEKYLGLAHPAGPGPSMQNSHLQHIERLLQGDQTFNTQYFGPSHGAGLLLQCKELSDFVRTILLRVRLSNPQREQYQSSIENKVDKRVLFGEPPSKERLISLVPARARADRLLESFLNVFESTYRVLHVPTLLRRYEGFWELPNVTADSTIVHILLAMATVNAFVPGGEDGFIGHSSAARQEAKLWIRAAQSWLSSQSQKNYTLDIIQVHVLLFHAKKMNCMERKRRWTSVGSLVRVIMAAGLHREPTHLIHNMSFFEAELRRRLWYTVLELEVQEASDRGMQPMFNGESWDCSPPLNISDEDFDEATVTVPRERPIDSYTRTSFLCTAKRSFLLRLDVLSKANSVRNPLDLEATRRYVKLLNDSLDELPRWPEKSISAVPRALSRLILYEQLMVLQQPSATKASSNHGTSYWGTGQRQTAIAVMDSYRSLPRPENLQLFNVRGDGFRAVLAMCFEAVRSNSPIDDLLHNKEAEIELIEHTVNLLEDRVKSLGYGFQFYWLALAALHLIKTRYSKVPTENSMTMATAERACRLLNYVKQRRKPDPLDPSEVQELHPSSQSPNILDAFGILADFSPDDWLVGCDIGYIWNQDSAFVT